MAGLSRRAVITGGGAAALALGSRAAFAQETRFFRIATGPIESGNFAIGTLIGNVVSAPPGSRDCDRGGNCGVPGLIAVTQTTAGALANIDAIREHRFESGLCQADIAYWAYHGTGLYRKGGAVKNIRALANLYPETLHIVVRRAAKITGFKHLRGKAVSLGERDSGTLVTARAVLQSLGISEREIKAHFMKPAEAGDAMREGKIDAFFEMSGLPSQLVSDLASHVEIDLLKIEGPLAQRLLAAYPFFTPTTIPARTYRGPEDSVATVSVGVVWVVDAEIDEKIVYGLAKALWNPNNRRTLDNGHPYGRLMKRDAATDGVAFPLHPGAALYYFEIGLIK